MNVKFTEKIEILSVDLLDRQRPLVESLRRQASSLGLEFGWHYLLDLTWILSKLGPVQNLRIMDAGAGTGVIQWHLAAAGADVISVDRGSRANLPLRFRSRFQVHGLRQDDLHSWSQTVRNNLAHSGQLRARITGQARDLLLMRMRKNDAGEVLIYNQDLKDLVDIPDCSVDAVVAVSALEHNAPEDLELVVTELMRILKPGRPLLATVNAARDRDWYHEPSSGWCYTEASLRQRFNLSPQAPANYDRYDELFQKLKDSAELRDNLARFYYRSGDNGMPWGQWAPSYIPVGICKIKE